MIRPSLAPVAALSWIVLFLVHSTLHAQPKKPDELGAAVNRLMKPADPVRATANARAFAAQVLPAIDKLVEKGDWKLPWEFPEDFFINPTAGLFRVNMKKIQRQTEDRYWELIGEQSAFVGMKADDARKNIDEVLRALTKDEGGDLAAAFKRQMLLLARDWPSVVHKTPTLAIALDRSLKLVSAVKPVLDKKPTNPAEAARQMIAALESVSPEFKGLGEEQLKDEIINAFLVNRKFVTMHYFRTTNLEELKRLVALGKKGDLKDDDGKFVTLERALQQRKVHCAVVMVSVRLLDANALERIAADDEAAQATLEKTLSGFIPPEFAGKLPPPSVERLKEWGQLSYLVTLPQLRIKGENKGTFFSASLRNGVLITDIEVYSEMPEAEARADLEFFLRLMHEKTLWGRAAAGGK